MKPKLENDGASQVSAQIRVACRRALFWTILAPIVMAQPIVSVSYGQAAKVSADRVQAAYLFNFGKFVRWPAIAPANRSGAFTICTIEGDSFGAVLQSTLAGESVGGKPVAVKQLEKMHDAETCHILFISSARARELKSILSAVEQTSVLTVSDMPDFSKRGGMIQFVAEGDRLRFEINLEGTEKSHLVLPSELLKVAVSVRRAAGTGE
jgi:hypothetical protein